MIGGLRLTRHRGVGLALRRNGALRLFLALSVAAGHLQAAPFRLLNASVAVLCFFIISGFYMAMVLTEKYDRCRPFYVARLVRFYPAYIAMIAVFVLWLAFLTWKTGNQVAFVTRGPDRWWERAIIIELNLTVLGQDFYELMNNVGAIAPLRSIFSPRFFDHQWMLIGQAWSLSSEAFFYLMAPFVVRKPVRIVALLVGSLALRALLLGALGYASPWGYRFFPCALAFFLMGALAYHVHKRIALTNSNLLGSAALAVLAAWLLSMIVWQGIALQAGAGSSIDEPRFWVFYILFAFAVPLMFEATKNAGTDRAVGELSYPLYLAHGLILGYLWSRMGPAVHPFLFMACALGASIVAAVMMRHIVERPIEVRRSRIAKSAVAPA
jgi:peptidoglycan/LPS O-acetylase OafA/YrhL